MKGSCAHCGAEFEARPSARRRFCSGKCGRAGARRDGWVIVDLEDGRPHVPRVWDDPRDAFRELLDMLLPYGLGDEWRRRLEVGRLVQ